MVFITRWSEHFLDPSTQIDLLFPSSLLTTSFEKASKIVFTWTRTHRVYIGRAYSYSRALAYTSLFRLRLREAKFTPSLWVQEREVVSRCKPCVTKVCRKQCTGKAVVYLALCVFFYPPASCTLKCPLHNNSPKGSYLSMQTSGLKHSFFWKATTHTRYMQIVASLRNRGRGENVFFAILRGGGGGSK